MRISADKIEKIRRYVANGRVVVFDTETTGCLRHDEICQIAAVEYVGGERARTFSVYVCPTCEMNPWAQAVHGLSMDFLFEHGLAPEDAMRLFYEFLGNDVMLVAHNNRFDMRMLRQECKKFELCFAPKGLETCDTLALARHLRPGLEHYKLSNLISELGVEGVNSHDALDDALACAGVFFKLLGYGPEREGKLQQQENEMIKIVQGDITTLAVDAIVNAANQVMLGGGGVDGAIHRAAGRGLYEACLNVPEVRPGVRCPTGEARITPGFKLPAKFVIHTVGPVYRDGNHGEPEKLAACYRNSLALAAENGCASIAFPCISTGVYGYPKEEAAEIAVREVREFLTQRRRDAEDAEKEDASPHAPNGRAVAPRPPEMEVIFCCFSESAANVYRSIVT